MKNKTKDNNIFKSIITILFKLSAVSLISVTGYLALCILFKKDFSIKSINDITGVILTIATPIIFARIELKYDKKIINNWKPVDYILLAIAIIIVSSYIQIIEGLQFWILSIAFIIYMFSGLLIFICNNRFIIVIFIFCMVYGSIDNKGYEIIIAIVTYTLSNLNKDDIKRLLNIRYFEDKKFIQDKFKAIIAIISTAFTNLIGNKIWDILDINNKVEISGWWLIFLKGYFRFMFFIIVYAFIIYLLDKNKPKLKKRYTDIY